MRTSIVIVTYRRNYLLYCALDSIARQAYRDFEVIVVEDGANGDEARSIVSPFAFARYVQRVNRPDVAWSNPAVPFNIGIQHSRGEIVVFLSGGGCVFRDNGDLGALVAPHDGNSRKVVMASIRSLEEDGSEGIWFCHPQENRRKHFAATSVRRDLLRMVRGMDEDYKGYGFDDDDLALRLETAGASFHWLDTVVDHKFHHSHRDFGFETNQQLFEQNKLEILAGRYEANLGREWGAWTS